MAEYVGTHCKVAACPPMPKQVRAEQNILAVQIEKLSDTTCAVTQITSITFHVRPLLDLSPFLIINLMK